MKKVSLTLLLLAGTATFAVAQPPHAGPNLNLVEDTLEELQVDDSRIEEILAIMQSTQEKQHTIMNAAREESHALRKETHEKMASVLTEEELSSFKSAMQEQKRAFRKGKHRGQCGYDRDATVTTETREAEE